MAQFTPRLTFPPLTSLPRSYYLGHHAAGLAKMRTLLSQIDLIIECRDYRIPLTSRNPLFEEALKERRRVVVYTKKDLGCGAGPGSRDEDAKRQSLLRNTHPTTPLRFIDSKSPTDIRSILDLVKKENASRQSLTGAHCLIVGMPNIGKSTLLNSLRHAGVRKGKVASTGAQPGVTRKIATSVKIISGSEAEGESGDVYLLDTPGVFIPYVPDASAMLKLALCGCVKDDVIPPFTLADYLLYHLNLQDPSCYAEYSGPTNEIGELLDAMARKTGRLQKGGVPDLDGTAMWMIQRWRNGHLGRFLLDALEESALQAYRVGDAERPASISQARKAQKEVLRARSRAWGVAAASAG